MRLPRDVSGKQLIKALSKLGFTAERQSGSHVRLRHQGTGDSVTVPMHDPIRVGTLSRIVADVTAMAGVERETLIASIIDSA
jgi:predicted RNA binding protein YcfA (HicA-like mRNA interferase family)